MPQEQKNRAKRQVNIQKHIEFCKSLFREPPFPLTHQRVAP